MPLPDFMASASVSSLSACAYYPHQGAQPVPFPQGQTAELLRMLDVIQNTLKFNVYLDYGTHLGAVRNASVLASDGDADVVIAPHYSPIFMGLGWPGAVLLLEGWYRIFGWENGVLAETLRLGAAHLPPEWMFFERPYGNYLSTLSTHTHVSGVLTPAGPNLDVSIESPLNQQRRRVLFGDLCRCSVDRLDLRCVERGEIYAECLYGPTWRIPRVCVRETDHGRKPVCEHMILVEHSPNCNIFIGLLTNISFSKETRRN
jgi:hypothetical protein